MIYIEFLAAFSLCFLSIKIPNLPRVDMISNQWERHILLVIITNTTRNIRDVELEPFCKYARLCFFVFNVFLYSLIASNWRERIDGLYLQNGLSIALGWELIFLVGKKENGGWQKTDGYEKKNIKGIGAVARQIEESDPRSCPARWSCDGHVGGAFGDEREPNQRHGEGH